MISPKRRTLWKAKAEEVARPSSSSNEDILNPLLRDLGYPTLGAAEISARSRNALASWMAKISLATTVGAFAVLSPSSPALGSDQTSIDMLHAVETAPDEVAVETIQGTDGSLSVTIGTPPKADADDEKADSGKDGSLADVKGDASDSDVGDDTAALGEFSATKSTDDDITTFGLEEGEPNSEIALMAGGTLSANSQVSFQSAIESLGADGTISLSGSFSVSGPLEIPSNAKLIIKLNGKTITASGSAALNIGSGASLTITGPGTIRNTSGTGNVLSASGTVGGLRIDGSASLVSNGTVFSDISQFTGTIITPGCSFSDTQGMLAFKDNYQAGQEITYSKELYTLVYWPDPDKESWYAKFLFVYCPTEADYELYVKHFGSKDVDFPETTHTVTFKTTGPDNIIKRDTVLQGHCVGDKLNGVESSVPTNEQMQALAPNGTTFKGWLDSKGKLYSIEDICGLPVMADTVYTAKFEKIPDETVDPVGPVGPVGPTEPVNPGSNPPSVFPGPHGSQSAGDNGGSVLPIGADDLRMPQTPATPWNPPGLAMAAGFTVPTSGPGVVVLDEFGEPVIAGAGAGDGDGDDALDGVSLFDAEQMDGSSLPFSGADVVLTLTGIGGIGLATLIGTRIASFFSANARFGRSRRRKALGLG